jgi:hypothetical protein
MKRLYLYLLTSITLTAGSCNFLDVTPEHQLAPENYFNTEAELLRGLVGVYDVLGSTNTYGNYMLGRMGLDADQGFYSRNELTGVAVYDAYPTDILIRDVWRTFYDGINRANFLLENIDKPDIAENRRDVIKGEAKFLRAFYYYVEFQVF